VPFERNLGVKSVDTSSRWSTGRRSSRSAPSRRASGRSGSRRAARATASASIRSDFADGARAVADVRHQLRQDPNYPFACGDQIAFEPPTQVAAVLDSPPSITTLFSHPTQQRQVAFACVANGFRRQLSSRPIDNDGGVGALVCIDPDDPRGDMSPAQVAGRWHGPVDRHIPVGASPRSSGARSAGPNGVGRPAAELTSATEVKQRWSEPANTINVSGLPGVARFVSGPF